METISRTLFAVLLRGSASTAPFEWRLRTKLAVIVFERCSNRLLWLDCAIVDYVQLFKLSSDASFSEVEVLQKGTHAVRTHA